MSEPAISQHLRVLEETGVLRRTIEGRNHRLWIQPGVLSERGGGLGGSQARPWGRLFGVVDE